MSRLAVRHDERSGCGDNGAATALRQVESSVHQRFSVWFVVSVRIKANVQVEGLHLERVQLRVLDQEIAHDALVAVVKGVIQATYSCTDISCRVYLGGGTCLDQRAAP